MGYVVIDRRVDAGSFKSDRVVALSRSAQRLNLLLPKHELSAKHWDRLPAKDREFLSQLKSSDVSEKHPVLWMP